MGVLRNFAKAHRKTPVAETLYKQNFQASACNFIKKEVLAQVFSCEFCVVSKNIVFTEHLWATASVSLISFIYFQDRKRCNLSYQI